MSIRIVQGENKVFTMKLRDNNGDPFDLTNFDEYKVCFPKLNNEFLEVSQTANANGSVVALEGLAVLGQLKVTVNYQDSATLLVGERQDIGLVLNNNATPNPKSENFGGVLDVEKKVCS